MTKAEQIIVLGWCIISFILLLPLQFDMTDVPKDPPERRTEIRIIRLFGAGVWPAIVVGYAVYGVALAVRAVGRWLRWRTGLVLTGWRRAKTRKFGNSSSRIVEGPYRGDTCERCGKPRE